jgi:hypothetical protein
MINIKDANDNWICIKSEDFYEALRNNMITVLGISLDGISELLAQYNLRNGVHPITIESIREIFKERKR